MPNMINQNNYSNFSITLDIFINRNSVSGSIFGAYFILLFFPHLRLHSSSKSARQKTPKEHNQGNIEELCSLKHYQLNK